MTGTSEHRLNAISGNMKLARRLFFVLLSAALFPIAAFTDAQAASEYTFKSESWNGSSTHSKKTGRFSLCMIAAEYKSGVMLGLGLTRGGRLFITLQHKNWNLKRQTAGNITYRVDSHKLGTFPVTIWGTHQIGTIIGKDELAFRRLQRGRVLRAVAAQKTFRFKLTGTHAALRKTKECVVLQLASERGIGNPFETSVSNPFAAGTRRKPSRQSSLSSRQPADDNRSLWRSIVQRAGGQNIKFISLSKSLREGGFKYAWTVDDTFGFVGQWKATKSVNFMMGLVFAYFDGACKGKYGYGSEKTKFVGRRSMKSGFAACQKDGKLTSTYATGVISNKTFTFIGHTAPNHSQQRAKEINDGIMRTVGAAIGNS